VTLAADPWHEHVLGREITMSRLVGGAIAAGAAGLGLVGAGVVKGIAGEDHTTRDEAGVVVEAGEVGAFRIQLGDCIATIPPDGAFDSVDAVPCSRPHGAEVYAAFMIRSDDDAAWPGETAVNTDANDGCYQRFTPFVGLAYEQSAYDFFSITPTQQSWEEIDDREVLCMIAPLDGSLSTGSAEGTAK
jgi:hypothetical protein